MNKFKKLFASLAIIALSATLVPTSVLGAATYSAELEGAYDYAYSIGATTMSTIDNANMHGNLIRSHMAKMMVNYAKEVLGLTPDTSKACLFTDIANETEELKGYIIESCQLGLMGQGITAFNPRGVITRAQFGTVLSRALYGDAYNVDTNPYYAEHLKALRDAGIMTNISNPDGVEMRGRVMLMMQRSDPNYVPVDEEGEVILPGLANVSRVGSVETQSVPYDAVNVKVGTIKLTAGENDTRVSSVEISRDGLATFTLGELQVALRSAKMETTYASVSSTTNTARVRFSPALILKARSSMEFDVIVKMDTNTEVNNTHNFKVTDVIVANGTSTGTPVTLNTVKTTSAKSKEVNVTVTNVDTTLKAGDISKVLAKVEVSFDQAAGTLNRFTLENVAAWSDDLFKAFDNVKAYVGDSVVGEVNLTKDKILVSNLNIAKAKDEKVIIEIKADVVYTKASANFKFQMDSIDALEAGFGLKPVGTLLQVSNINVVGYDVVFKKETIVTKNVLPGTNNVVVFDSTIKVATDTLIKEVEITPTVTNLDKVLKAESAKLIVNGEQFPITDVQIVGGAFTISNMDVGIDANRTARIQIVLNTKVPTPMVDASARFKVEVTNAESADDSTVSYGAIAAVNGDTVKIEAGKVVVATSTVAAPVTRSLFSEENQEVGRFSIKADGDYTTLKKLDLGIVIDGVLLTVPLLKDMFDGNFTLVNVANNETISAKMDINVAGNKLEIRNMNYRIEKDQTVNLKLMVNLPKIDTAAIEWTIAFAVVVDTIEAVTSIQTVTTNAAANLSNAVYTLRVKAPSITLSKVSANQFKVTIKNVDGDEKIDIENLDYRVRTVSANADYPAATKVCVTEDINLSVCAVGQDFGKVVTALAGGVVTLDKNEEKVYYILVDGTFIEPEVLRADISSLSYAKEGDLTATENYNVIAQ